MQISLKAARVNANLTQKDASTALQIDKSTIINWEMGRSYPRADQLKRLSILYNMPIDNITLSSKSTLS